MKKPIVYIASPYTKGDQAINTHFQMRVFDDLMNDGVVWPVVPLWSHFQHATFPRHYQDWIDYDLALIERYDACLRLNAEFDELKYRVTESSGADGEVARFKAMGRPVFYNKKALYEWANEAPSRQVVGLCGFAGAGKDEAAKTLVARHWTRVAFADAVREAVQALDPMFEYDGANERRTCDLLAQYSWKEAKAHPEMRRLLQRMGTEAGRNIHGEDCWVNIARRKILVAYSDVVVTDIRFANEAAMIRELGGRIVRIERPGVGPVNGHCSEAQELDADDTIINDGSIEQLHETIRQLVVSAELEAQ